MNRDEVYLRHILDAIQKIERYAEVGYDRFVTRFTLTTPTYSPENSAGLCHRRLK